MRGGSGWGVRVNNNHVNWPMWKSSVLFFIREGEWSVKAIKTSRSHFSTSRSIFKVVSIVYFILM